MNHVIWLFLEEKGGFHLCLQNWGDITQMRSFCQLSMAAAGCIISVNNLSVFAERDIPVVPAPVVPVSLLEDKQENSVGRRSLRSNEGEEGERDWAHFERQSAFALAESLGDLYFCPSFVLYPSVLDEWLCVRTLSFRESKITLYCPAKFPSYSQ